MSIHKSVQVMTHTDDFDSALIFIVQQIAENQLESPNVTIQAVLSQVENADHELAWVPGFNVILSGEVKPQCDPVPVS